MVATAIDFQPSASLNDEECEQRVDPQHFIRVLEKLIEATVAPEVDDIARIALHRMREI